MFGINWETDLISTLGAAGFFALVLITVFVVGKYINDIKKGGTPTAPLSEESWDGIGEYKNEIPVGYFASFFGLIIWAAWYFVLGYPVQSYSQIGEYNQEVEAHTKKFEEKWANMDAATLSAMGESVFLAKCAPCHGETGDGMNGKAANLNEFGREAHIKSVIKNGSKGLVFPMGEMPAGLADDTAADKIASYVVTLHGGKATDAAKAAEGQALFVATCAACHGEDGKGMDGAAPNLTQYGTPAFISEVVLKRGKQGHIGGMPSFDKEGTLNPTQYNAVATYIMSDK